MGFERIRITVMSGAEDGRVFELDKTAVTLGRHPDDDVYLPQDNRISRHHARITREGDSYFVEDVGPQGKGSTNGTYTARKKVVDRMAITSGEIIVLGTVAVKFELL